MWYTPLLLTTLLTLAATKSEISEECRATCLSSTSGIAPCSLLSSTCICSPTIFNAVKACVLTSCSLTDAETATEAIESFCRRYKEEDPDTTSTRSLLPVPLPTPTTSTSASTETKGETATATGAKGSGSVTVTTTGTVKSTSTGTRTGLAVPTESSGAVAGKLGIGMGFEGAVGGVGAVVLLVGAFVV